MGVILFEVSFTDNALGIIGEFLLCWSLQFEYLVIERELFLFVIEVYLVCVLHHIFCQVLFQTVLFICH